MDKKQNKYWLEKIKDDSDERILRDILLSEENGDRFSEIYNIQKASNELKDWRRVDSQKAWNIIDEKTSSKKLFSFKYMSIAAAVLILGISVLFMNSDTVYSAGNSEKHLVLSDGSDIILSPNSQLTVTDNFNESVRKVQLTGDAYFNVSKNKEKPFVITMDKAKIKVLGTVFYVDQSAKGAKVDLISGKVEIIKTDGNKSILKEKETALIYDEVKIESLNIDEIPKSEDLLLDDVSIKDAVNILNDIYGKKIIELKEPESKLWDKTIHTTIRNSSVREFINGLELIFDVKVINSKGKFIVSNLKMK